MASQSGSPCVVVVDLFQILIHYIEYKYSFIIQVQKVMKDLQTPTSGIERYSMVSVGLQETKNVLVYITVDQWRFLGILQNTHSTMGMGTKPWF